MRYITLTDECVNFEFVKTKPNGLTLTWNVAHDLSNVTYIGINSFHLSTLKYHNDSANHSRDAHIRIYTNLISRTVTNPTRRILDLKIPKSSNVAETKLNMSTIKYIC